MLRGGLVAPGATRRLGRGIGRAARAVAAAVKSNIVDKAAWVASNSSVASADPTTGTISWTGRTSVTNTPLVPAKASSTYAVVGTFNRSSGSANIRLFVGSVNVLLLPGTNALTLTTGAGDAGGAVSVIPTQTFIVGTLEGLTIIEQ